jgi:MFS family permease
MEKNEAPLWRRAGFGALLLLTFINLFNYLDRYILVALSPTIKHELGLSDTEVGFLATAFMLSYFLISPVFGWLGDRKPRYRLMSVGVGLWSLATAASGWAQGFRGLLTARFSVGVGEAAYGAISPSLLTDLYPRSLRGKAFALFFMAIPVGSALGYLLGGFLEKAVGWRFAFLVAGIPGLLLALALLFLKEPKRGALDEEEEAGERKVSEVLGLLAGNADFMLTTLGYCAYTFVLGGVAVWIPHYIERYLSVSAANGNMAFGGITVAAGFLGTFVGGAWADRWAARGTDAYLKLSSLSMLVALPVYALVLLTSSFSLFCLLVFLLEFLLFLSTSPVNAQIMHSVPPSIRATANAVNIFLIHLLGDAISPTLVGFVSDQTNLKAGMWVFTGAILLAALFWAWKVVVYWECLPWPKGAFVLPKAQCHRGFHPEGVQENTLEAFRGAARAGAKMVELDVRLASDGVAVVVHDPDIRRVSGKEGMVTQLSAAELKRRANLPSLREVLEDPACKGLFVNVELKSDTARDNGLERAVARAVREAKGEGRVLFSSFNPLALRRISRLLPEAPRALLATNEIEDGNKFYLRKMLLAFLARPHMLNYDERSLSPGRAAFFRACKRPFAVWTVIERDEARKFLAMGAESIISPIPDIL